MANNYDCDIGILGGEGAGLTIATGSAQLGAITVLIEKRRNLGGDCFHYRCIQSKALIRAAKVDHLMKKAKEYEIPEAEGLPPVDFQKVVKRMDLQNRIIIITSYLLTKF
tara:strand:+ start:2412 stop:2741 length:330 start_codon:yes stop_codon:yes gene_type:complete